MELGRILTSVTAVDIKGALELCILPTWWPFGLLRVLEILQGSQPK